MQYEKNGIFAFMGRRDELCIRNLNTQLHDRMITAMKKCYYSQAPLPFVGQKRMFASEFSFPSSPMFLAYLPENSREDEMVR